MKNKFNLLILSFLSLIAFENVNAQKMSEELQKKQNKIQKKQHEFQMKQHDLQMQEHDLQMKEHEKQMQQHDLQMKALQKSMAENIDVQTLKMAKLSEKSLAQLSKLQAESLVENVLKIDDFTLKMKDLGESLNLIGTEIDKDLKINEQKLNKAMRWFFAELKSDKIIEEIGGEHKIFIDEDSFKVNKKIISDELRKKYWAELEKQLEAKFNDSSSFMFNGEVYEDFDGSIRMTGSQSMNFSNSSPKNN